MACKESLFLLNKINYFCMHWFIAKKVSEATKEKKDVVLNLSHLNLRHYDFDFHLSTTVVAVYFFVVVAADAVVVPVVAADGKDIQEQ